MSAGSQTVLHRRLSLPVTTRHRTGRQASNVFGRRTTHMGPPELLGPIL